VSCDRTLLTLLLLCFVCACPRSAPKTDPERQDDPPPSRTPVLLIPGEPTPGTSFLSVDYSPPVLSFPASQERPEVPGIYLALSDGVKIVEWKPVADARFVRGEGEASGEMQGSFAQQPAVDPVLLHGGLEDDGKTARLYELDSYGEWHDWGGALELENLLELDGPPPTVRRLFDPAGGSRQFNLLFLGDGFRQDELPSYRAAAETLARHILETPPFCRFADRFAFYRIDVVDPGGNVLSACESRCGEAPARVTIDASFTATELEPLLPIETLNVDFGLTRCWSEDRSSPGHCQILWSGRAGRAKMLAAARQTDLPITTVVVLANIQAKIGSGYGDSHPRSTGISVIGLPMTIRERAWGLTNSANIIFEHELGHAFGLLDEYTDKRGIDPPFPKNRNVWDPRETPPWSRNRAAPLPWGRLIEPCKPFRMTACVDESTGCSYIGSDEDVSSFCKKHAQAWEGAFYQETGYYRASHDCRMRSRQSDSTFCPACLQHLRRRLCGSPLNRADCPPFDSLTTCPAP